MGIQLRLRSSFEQWMELDLRSYVRVDTECTVPLDILKPKSKSLQSLRHYLNRGPSEATLEQPRPIVQTQTEMKEAH